MIDESCSRGWRGGWLRGLPWLAVLLTFAWVEVAHADVRTEARRHFRRGMTLIQEGSVDEGVTELQEAYDILPHPNVLYNIARAYAEAGRYDEALDYFEQYLASDPPDREEVNGFVQAIEQRIGAERVAQTGTPETGTATTESGATRDELEATQEEIDALHDAAQQIETLAAATQSEALRQRAQRLREVAEHLRPTRRDEGTTGATTTGDGGAGGGLALGRSQEDLYEEEVVSASRFAQSPLDAPNAISTITRQDIRMTGITHIGELIRRVAGADVMRISYSDTEIGIRGFNQRLSPRVLVLIDGRSVYVDPLGVTFYAMQSIAVEDIERIEVIRGPASALYGADAFSGIINIITRAPGADPGTEAQVGAGNQGIFRAHTATSGRSGNLRYRMTAGFEQGNQFQQVDRRRLDTNFAFDDTHLGLRSYFAQANLRYRASRDVSLFAEGGVAQTRQVLQATGPLRELTAEGPAPHVLAGIETTWGKIRYFWNRTNINAGREAFDTYQSQFNWDTHDVEGEFSREFHLGIDHNFHFGGAYRRKVIDWDFIGPQRTENHGNLFLQEAARLTDWLTMIASLRVDFHPLIDEPIVSPRGAIVMKPTERSAFRLSGGRAFRTQTFLESYFNSVTPGPIAGVTAPGIGNNTDVARARGIEPLVPERIISGEIGYRNMESDYFDVELSAYYNNVTDLVVFTELNPYTFQELGQPDLFRSYDLPTAAYLIGTTGFANDPTIFDVVGGEAAVRVYPVEGLDIFGNYAYNRTFLRNAQGRVQEERTSRHKVNGGIQYRAPFGLDVAIDVHFVTKQTWSEQDFDAAGNLRFVELVLPAYYIVNARVGWRLLDDRLDLGVVGYNITNNEHRQHPFGQVLSARVMGTLSYRF